MTALPMTTEITVLGWSVLLLLVQVVLQAGTSADLGPTYLFSPRDERREPQSIVAQRLKRALDNLLETYPAFVALALALTVTGKAGGIAATGRGSTSPRGSSMSSSMPPASRWSAPSSGWPRSSASR